MLKLFFRKKREMNNKIKIYQIDAFTDELFKGNPAAVCILDTWLTDELMQQIAAENNLAETAFAVKHNNSYEIRWFTPAVEVDLCGHATLATAFVLFKHYGILSDKINFHSKWSGELSVEKSDNDLLTLDFPADTMTEVESIDELNQAIGKTPVKTLKGKTDFMLVFSSQIEIEEITPNFGLLAKFDGRGAIVTAKGNNCDLVSRFFAPQSGINEDPVTGSAHTSLTPYWSNELSKKKLSARQLSKRGGSLTCEMSGDRVKISGNAVEYMVGEINI